MTISLKWFLLLTVVFREDITSFLHGYIEESGHGPLRPCL